MVVILCFAFQEKAFLHKLPTAQFEPAHWKVATVQYSYHKRTGSPPVDLRFSLHRHCGLPSLFIVSFAFPSRLGVKAPGNTCVPSNFRSRLSGTADTTMYVPRSNAHFGKTPGLPQGFARPLHTHWASTGDLRRANRYLLVPPGESGAVPIDHPLSDRGPHLPLSAACHLLPRPAPSYRLPSEAATYWFLLWAQPRIPVLPGTVP